MQPQPDPGPVDGGVGTRIDSRMDSRMDKGRIVEELGDAALALPSLVQRGLQANQRAKYLLALLQTARAHADAPGSPAPTLADERAAAGLADPALDRVVAGSTRLDDGSYLVPRAQDLVDELVAEVRVMRRAATVAGVGDDGRLEALVPGGDEVRGDRITGACIDRLTAAPRPGADSLHGLVMAAHRDLDSLQRTLASGSVDGAATYGLDAGDTALVAAFMEGLHSTEALRFGHPGLDTTATRIGDRLLLENDLGTTDVHVLVVTVTGSTATVTYSDLHPRRLAFVRTLLDPAPVRWSDEQSRPARAGLDAYHLVVGTFEAADVTQLREFLRLLGSRVVFVLDWNRARKRLQTYLSRADAAAVLRWAVDANVGHRAFLVLGAERMIFDALELAAKVPARFGESVVDVLGRDATLVITRFALRACTEGLLAGKSPPLIRDELRVEVLRHVRAVHGELLDLDAAHAALIAESAQALRAAVDRLGHADAAGFLGRTAARAARWEHRADDLLADLRRAGARVDGGQPFADLASAADDAIDELEEAVALLGLLPAGSGALVGPLLQPVAAVAVASAREHVKAVEAARAVVSGGAPDDLEDLLVAVDRVVALEHDADEADRAARGALVDGAPDFRTLYVADGVSRAAETATDALARSAQGLRDHLLTLVPR